MLPRIPKSVSAAVLLGVLAITMGARTAWAFGDEATPFIVTIMQTSLEQLTQLQSVLSTLKKSYAAAKTVAQYADDARNAYSSFQHFNSKLFAQDIEHSFELAFPDAAYFRREASGTGPWAQGTGELQRLIGTCLAAEVAGRSGMSPCKALTERITTAHAKDVIAKTFGPIPAVAGGVEVRAVDHESAQAISGADTQLGRDLKTRATADALLKSCTDGTDNASSSTRCQAAANTATIQQLNATSDLTDQVATLRRLEAVRMAEDNARRKRELAEALERRQAELDSKQWLDAPQPELRTGGLQF